jgi:hypothetical protein
MSGPGNYHEVTQQASCESGHAKERKTALQLRAVNVVRFANNGTLIEVSEPIGLPARVRAPRQSSRRATKADVRILFQCDGYFEPIVGDLMEIGVNAINPLQPE